MTCATCGWYFHRDCEDCIKQQREDEDREALARMHANDSDDSEAHPAQAGGVES